MHLLTILTQIGLPILKLEMYIVQEPIDQSEKQYHQQVNLIKYAWNLPTIELYLSFSEIHLQTKLDQILVKIH